MTFAEYNTDDNFDKKESSLEELVKLGLAEGKTSDEIKSSLSPKWQKSKKIGEFDSYINKFSAPKDEEEKPTEEKVLEKVVTENAPQTEEEINLGGQTQVYADKQSKIANSAKQEALKDIEEDSGYNWQKLYDASLKRADAYKRIDDHMVDQLPTFMFKRYQNGEFGDPKSSDAKLRLAHFMINGVGTALQNASAAIKGGQMQESDLQKYNRTNLEEGLANRWTKYKADTEGAVKAVENEFGNEQNARHAVEQFTRDRKANTKWNMMDQNQKVYALQVTKEIGSMLGGMDTSELANFIAGAALTGDMSKDEVVAIGIAKIAAKAPEIIANLPDGDIKNMVASLIGTTPVMAGIGGFGSGSDSNGNETNLTGNIQNYKTIGGDTVSFDFADTSAGKKIQAVYDDLIDRYKKGEIDEATFKEYYDPMYAESKKHPGSFKTFFSSGSDEAIRKANVAVRVEVSEQIDALNEQAKNGEIKPSDYNERFKALKDKAQKYGASEKDLKSIDKGKVSDEKILKATERKNKKK